MKPNLDIALIEALPSLDNLHSQFRKEQERHLRRQESHGRILPLPNIVELALITSRRSKRIARWLSLSATERSANQVAVDALLKAPADFSSALKAQKLVLPSRIDVLATYLATTACPSTSSLSIFAEIDKQTARVWLKRLASRNIICMHSTARDLHAINPVLLSLLSGHSVDLVKQQFETLVQNPTWLRDSDYKLI